ncbi:unnamed protein product, partial [Effrenium voratum]
ANWPSRSSAWKQSLPGSRTSRSSPASAPCVSKPPQSTRSRMHFNSFVGGAGRKDLSPVCKRAASSEAESEPVVRELDISGIPGVQQFIESLGATGEGIEGLAELMSKLAEPQPDQASATSPPTPATATEYVKLPKGEGGCPKGAEILTFEECRAAIVALGLKPDPSWTSNYEGVPRYCSVRERPGEGARERMHFNTANKGAGREDLAPICLRGARVSNAAAKAKAKAETQAVQELSGRSQQRFLEKEKPWYLVYMRQGTLTAADED